MSDNFTKKDLVANIHGSTGIAQKDVRDVIQLMMDQIIEALLHGRNVELRNFGVFEMQLRKKRIGRNPNKPEKDVIIPDRLTVKFKVGKELKEKIKKLDVNKFRK